MFFIASIFVFICLIWMASRIWKSSPGLAVASFFILPIAIIPLLQNWGDEETDIKVPFFLALAGTIYNIYSLMSLSKELQEQQQSFLSLACLFA